MSGVTGSFLGQHRTAAAVAGLAVALCAAGVVLMASAGSEPAHPTRSISWTLPSTPAPAAPAAVPDPPGTAPPTEATVDTARPGPSSPAPGDDGAGAASSANAEMIIVCQSGTTSADGIDTSSEVATRVPVGSPIPPNCRAG
jgi:hypothetical protein